MNDSHFKYYLALIASLILWGLSFPAMKYSFSFDKPLTIMFYRYTISFFIILPIFLFKFGDYVKEITDKKSILFLGIFNFCGAFLQFIGVDKTSSTKSAIITQMLVIIVPIFAYFFLKERLNKKKLISIFISFIGAIILSTGLDFKDIFKNSSIIGDLLVMSGNFFWALYIIYTKKLTQKNSNFILLFSSILTTVIVFIPIIFINSTIINITKTGLGISFFLSLFCSIFPTLLYNFSLRKIEASTSAIIGPIEIISAVIVSYLFLGEKLNIIEISGGLLIIISFYMTASTSKYS